MNCIPHVSFLCTDIPEEYRTDPQDVVRRVMLPAIIVFTGTRIMEGSGKVVIVAVGVNSQAGIIFSLLAAANDSKKSKVS